MHLKCCAQHFYKRTSCNLYIVFPNCIYIPLFPFLVLDVLFIYAKFVDYLITSLLYKPYSMTYVGLKVKLKEIDLKEILRKFKEIDRHHSLGCLFLKGDGGL